MNKALYWLRLAASLPIYAVAILIWVQASKTVFKSAVLVFTTHLTPYRFGEVLGVWLFCVLSASIAYGMWLLGRYVRTSRFRVQPKPSSTDLP
ncbi:hypothetical protein [Pseudomonas sp. ML2-2023-6]|uniref:hypothetical protein n=1 Tax=Pseudomonas sp. ML2-2023-6 TaxID=3122376 RepID=UPI0030CFEE70